VLLSLRHVADIVPWLLHVLTHGGVRPTLLFDPEDGSDTFLRNVCWLLQDYVALYTIRNHRSENLKSNKHHIVEFKSNWTHLLKFTLAEV
jgi:hypothetical protein